MATTEEIIQRINQRIAELTARIESLTSPNQVGTSGRDFLVGNRFQDSFIDGGAGDDRIFGGFGNDNLLGSTGNDLMDGGNGDDYLSGGDGNDNLFGKLGNDTVDGGTGNNLIDGGLSDDFLFGNNGNDQLIGGPGNDQIFGGKGSDTITGNGNLTGDIEVDILVGGGDLLAGSVDPDGAPDAFVLGNSTTSFYTNSKDANSGGLFGLGDFAVILDFEQGTDKIHLGAARANFIAPIVNDFGLGLGTYIIDNSDLIGFVPSVALNDTDFTWI